MIHLLRNLLCVFLAVQLSLAPVLSLVGHASLQAGSSAYPSSQHVPDGPFAPVGLIAPCAPVTSHGLTGVSDVDFISGISFSPADLVDGLSRASLNAGLETAILGGSFDDALIQNLQTFAASTIGRVAANRIGAVYGDAIKDGRSPLEYGLHKAAHFAVGCATQELAAGECVAGGVGAVVGESVVEAVYSPDRIAGEIKALRDSGAEQAAYDAYFAELAQNNVDVAKLSGAFAAFLAGADGAGVNAAAAAGANAAQNNWVFLVVRAGLLAWTVYEVIDAGQALGALFDQVYADGELTAAEAAELRDVAAAAGITITFEVVAGKVVKGLRIVEVAGGFTQAIARKLGLDDLMTTLNKKFDGVGGAKRGLPNYSTSQLQHEFKHAGDFGVTGNWNKANGEAFKTAINNHIKDPATQVIQGSYRNQPATLYYNSNTGNVSFNKPDGSFWGAWKLSPAQVQNVTTHGNLQ